MSSDSSSEGYLQIGEAAERAGLTQRTLRYYEEKGLLPAPTRMDGGFRLYSEADMERIDRVKEAKELLGFSLADIKDMLDASDVIDRIRAEWRNDADAEEKAAAIRRAREVTLQQMELIEKKIEAMEAMRTPLQERLAFHERLLREYAEADPATAHT